MSDRHLKMLLGVLVVLLAAWGIARLVSGGGGSAEAAPFELALGEDAALDSVIIRSSEDTVRLRAGDGWTVNGYEALADAGSSLERAFNEAEVGPLVSRNPENHGRLGVSEGAGRHVTVYVGGAEEASLIIGGRGRSFRQAYVRQPGADAVYSVQGTLISLVNRGVDEWRDRQILSVERADIEGLEYAYGDTTFTLARDSTGWSVEPAGVAAEESAVNGILNQLSGLRGIGFAADDVADSLSWDGSSRLRVLGPGGSPIAELSFYPRAEDVGYYVRKSGSAVVYTLSKFSGDQIVKREADLLPAEGEAPEESTPEAPAEEAGAAETVTTPAEAGSDTMSAAGSDTTSAAGSDTTSAAAVDPDTTSTRHPH